MAGDIPQDYRKDFSYLEELSSKGALQASNAIYQKLKGKSQNLPGLKRALESLNVRH